MAQVNTAPTPETPPSPASPKPGEPPPAGLKPPKKDDQKPAALDRVEIVAPVGDSEIRRASTAAKIVIGKEEIERFGDGSVSEVLKRLPGVTTGGRPGRGGDVRMRGMGGGYTQVLVNGERMPPGFSLDSLPPDQVERIEVMRAPTAEFGAQAVAGTINIVLKEALKRTLNEVKLGASLEDGKASPNASWTRNDKYTEAISYTVTLSVNRNDSLDKSDTRTRWYDLPAGTQVLDQHETGSTLGKRDGVNLNGRVQIALGEGESMLLTPFLVLSKGVNSTQGQLDQTQGGAVVQPYTRYTSEGDGRFALVRTNTQWQKTLGEGKKVEVRYGVGHGTFESRGVRNEFGTFGQPNRTVDDLTYNRESSWTLTGKLSQTLENEHSLVGGVELDNSQRRQNRSTLQDGLPILTEFGDDLRAASLRVAAYVQDEWNPTKQLAAYAGLRWEGIETRSDSGVYQARNQSSVLTPLLHATWKPFEASRDQFRSSLTRSYKAGTLGELIARPAISQRFPSGTNEVSSPDRAGNPSLVPELARGFEIAYEHYLSKGGLVSANYFYRRIDDLIRNVVALENVSWASNPRWVSRPQNVGNATAQGVELEAKFRMDEVWADTPPVALRGNVSFFDSAVDRVPGPNNRLEGQPMGTANLGADYKLRGLPISMGVGVNYTPAYGVQLSDIQSSTVGAKVVTDAFVLWLVNPNAQVRLSANNLLPRDYMNTSSVLNSTQRQDNQNANPSNVRWGVRLELKL